MVGAVSPPVDERVFAPRPRRVTAAAGERDTLVVIGNGMVGHRLCRRLVELGATTRYRVIVFGEEACPAYDRIHLTALLEGGSHDDLCLAGASWYEDHDIELRLGDPVVEIDRARRAVRSASGTEIMYRRVVIATGSSPYVPPIEGADRTSVLVYRTADDLCAIRHRARGARTAAIIGGGLLGLEAARALQRLGLQVTIVEAAAAIMPTQLDQDGGKELERQIAALGARVLTGAITRRIEATGRRRRLHLAGGDALDADIIVVAAGVRPRSELAGACGLALSREGGVVVDDWLRTTDPHIHAIGDCVSHRSRVYGLVAPGYAMADALAENLNGGSAAFAGVEPAVRLKLLDVDVASAGEPLERGIVLRFRSDGVYRRLRLNRGHLVGALGVGDWPEFARIQDATSRHARVWPWQLARFERTGQLWRSPRDLPVTEWPPAAVVCNCLNVTCGQIGAACSRGAATVESLIDETGASTLCGSCRPLLAALIGAGVAQSAPRTARGLLAASLAALIVGVATLVSAPVPFVTSVQDSFPPDALWRNGGYRQITGFVLLGLSALAALVTLRKRWRRVSLGAFATWRAAHAAIGALTLVGLAAHTGMRAGDNLNLALMVSFSTVNLVGAVAGGFTALEHKVGRPVRTVLVTMHVLAIWPLPMLIAFHVLSVYYF